MNQIVSLCHQSKKIKSENGLEDIHFFFQDIKHLSLALIIDFILGLVQLEKMLSLNLQRLEMRVGNLRNLLSSDFLSSELYQLSTRIFPLARLYAAYKLF